MKSEKMYWAVYKTIWVLVHGNLKSEDRAVWGPVYRAVYWASDRASDRAKDRPHPHLEGFLQGLQGSDS